MICKKIKKAFTMVEVIVATSIFMIVLVASFSLYKYLIRIGMDSRNIANIKNLQTTMFQGIKGISYAEGWENFLDNYLDIDGNTAEYTLKWNEASFSYDIVPANANEDDMNIYPSPASGEEEYVKNIFRWKFKIEADDSLGPYIQDIANTGGNYVLTFSQPLNAFQGLDVSLPCVNNPSHIWDTAAAIFTGTGSNILTITPVPAKTTITAGDSIKPSAEIKNTEGVSDITYLRGVYLPTNTKTCDHTSPFDKINKEPCGYPQLVKATVTILVKNNDTTDYFEYATSQYLRYE